MPERTPTQGEADTSLASNPEREKGWKPGEGGWELKLPRYRPQDGMDSAPLEMTVSKHLSGNREFRR